MIYDTNTIIQTSLISLGLVIALYAIIMQSLEGIISRRLNELIKTSNKRDKVFEKLKVSKDDGNLLDEYRMLYWKIKDLSSSPYHYNFGYIISGIFFTISLIFPYYSLYFETKNIWVFGVFVDKAPVFLFLGILNFIYVWFRTMIDFRNLTLEKFDNIQEKEQTKDKVNGK